MHKGTQRKKDLFCDLRCEVLRDLRENKKYGGESLCFTSRKTLW